ncbi:MAG: TrkH family potassium uptake protein [Lachnospiraceae bacterium]|nr:TrkH family potassium uptake protein [Lachnospiraceae bacterium]
MNYSMIIFILGHLLRYEALFMILPIVTGFIYGEKEAYAFLGVAILTFIIGTILTCKHPKNKQIYTRDGSVTVALGWIVLSLFGALPFTICGDIPFYIDAMFETISGFTTTGASILSDVEALSHASIMWRSFTHWVGGMGVFVFILSLLPMIGGSTMQLMKAESPGPSVDKFVPKVKDTAKLLYSIYIVITAIQIVCLLLAKMPLFDTLTLTFGSVGTGGFGIKNDSMASYTSLQQNIVTFFMIISGINYSFYFLIISKKFKDAFHLEEVRWYLGIILVAGILITLNILHLYGSIGEAIKHAFFQVGSIMTTTGYSSTDFNLWPEFSKTILILLMIIGACAGSTAGGFKVSRMLMLLKSIKVELSMMIHPREVKKIRMDGHVVKPEVLRTAQVYLVLYWVIFLLSVLLISVDNFNFTTNFTAVAATFNNIGPGLAGVGPMSNFGIYSTFSKIVLMVGMLIGRLELYPIILLLVPATWKRK